MTLPRRGIAGAAAGTVLFFGAVGGLPHELLRAPGVSTLLDLLPTLVAVGLLANPTVRRTVEGFLTAPYLLLVLGAIGLDVLVLRQGTLPAALVGILPAAGGVLSWTRPGAGEAG